MNTHIVFPLLIAGTFLWIFLMLFAESIRDTYYRVIRPRIKFVATSEDKSGYFEREGGIRKLIGVIVHLEGYFENEGGVPSTVKAIELQLLKKRWIFPKTIGRKINPSVFREKGNPNMVDDRGYFIAEYRSSPYIDVDATCFCGDKCPNKFDDSYFLRVRWLVIGQPIKNNDIVIDWEHFNQHIASYLSQPIPDIPEPQPE